MLGFKFLALSALSAAVFAAPTPQSGTGINDPYYQWQVTGWSAGCARSGCYYDFNVTGSEYNANGIAIPSFSAYCSGGPEGAAFTPCNVFDDGPSNRGVAAHLLPAETGTGAHIEVSLQWTIVDSTTVYNFTGNATASYNQFVAPLEAFTIEPSSAYGLA